MRKFILAAGLIVALALPAHAGASYDDAPGHWLDARQHLDMKYLPESSEAIGRLNYAKISCGGTSEVSANLGCMKANGFVWLADSPAQIAARKKAAQDAQMRASGYAIGQALIQAGQAMQPHSCNGMVMPAGNFSMQCY